MPNIFIIRTFTEKVGWSLDIETKRMSSNKTLELFYLWIYILTHAKRKFEPDLFHTIKDLVW